MKNRSLSDALRIYQSYLTISIACFFALFLITYEVLSYRNFIIDSFSGIGELVARNIVPAMTFKDTDEVARVLSTLNKNKEIVSATAYNAENKMLATTNPDTVAGIISNASQWKHLQYYLFIYQHSIIGEDKENMGKLVFVISIKPFLLDLCKVVFFTLLVSSLAVIAGQSIMNRLTNRVVVPLKNLGSRMATISQSKNYDLQIHQSPAESKVSYDEIDVLTHEFTHLMEVIRASNIDLKMLNLNLENLVTKRTKERDLERMKAVQSGKIAALGAMSAGIAHEINNPLAAIKVSSDILSMMVNEKMLDEKVLLKVTTDIHRMVERITTIIKGMRSFTRDGSQDPLVETDLSKIVEETLIFVSTRYKNNKVNLEVNVKEGDLKVMCRSSQISQVILNLLNNAYDAIELKEDKWVRVDTFKEDHKIGLTVTDCGAGIPKEILERLFEPFYTTKGLGKGTGIGLSISGSIMESNGGKLVYDETSPNTSFRIEFYV